MPAMEAKLASTYYEFFRCTYIGLLDEVGLGVTIAAFSYHRFVSNVVCMCLSLSFTRKARRFSRRRYAIKGYEFFRTSSFKLSMVRSLVIIVLRLREAGLKVTNNGIPCLPFCLERIGWKAWSREHALLW